MLRKVRQLRWPGGVRCPRCDAAAITKQGRDTTQPARRKYRCERCQRYFDDLTGTLPDTEENQAAFPQSSSQKPGLGFPICRVVGLLGLDSGALLDAAMGPCEGKGSDEQSLLREILDSLQSGDILLGDAFYATWFLLWDLIRSGVDGLFEQHGGRKRSTDFSKGEKIGVRDHLIVLPKPKKPDWMSQYEYDQAPATLKVRELQAGGKIMVTTFLCHDETPKHVLKALYRQRWNVELDLRNIKTTLGMEHLRCKTPEMAVKELWVYLLAYTDGAGRPVGRSNSPPAQLQAHGADLAFLAATRQWRSRCGGLYQRPAGVDRRAAGRLTAGANRAACPQTQTETVSVAHQTPSSRARGRSAKRAPEEAALNSCQRFLQ